MRSERVDGGIPQSVAINMRWLVLVVCALSPALIHGSDRKSRLEKHKLKTDLLTVMDVKGKPAVTRSRSDVPKYVLDLYKQQASSDGYTKHIGPPRTVRTFFRDKTANADERLFKFNVSSIDPSEWTSSADLRIFKRRSKIAKPRGHFKIRIFRLSRRPVEGGHDRWKRKAVLVDAKTVKCRRLGEWLSFNVTSAVAFWAKWPSRNFGLWVSVRGVEHVPDEDFEIATGGRKEPILVTFEQDKAKKYPARKPTRKPDADYNVRGRRHRREIMPDYEERCQKRKMFVRFKDLQWHKWIVAPRGFSAYHCQGTCPEVLDQHYDPTNHAVIQNLLHHRYSRKIPAACCVPTSLHSISMLYFELDGSIVLREYSGMVASTCGCR